MAENHEFDEILNVCLDKLAGGAGIDECLALYPELADELRPLLKTAAYTRLIMQDVKPDPAFKTAARYKIGAIIDEAAAKPRRRAFTGLMPRWALSTLTAVLLVIAGGTGTVAAASGTMPDNFLYPVKLTSEQVQLSLTFSDLKQAELNSEFASRRIEELTYTVSLNDEAAALATVEKLNSNLMMVAAIPDTNGDTAATFSSMERAPMKAIAPEETGPETTTADDTETQTVSDGTIEPSVAPAPEADTAPAPASAEGGGIQIMGSSPGDTAVSEEAELTMVLAENQASQWQQLQALLATAPDSLKPAIEDAIRLLEESYGTAIFNWSR